MQLRSGAAVAAAWELLYAAGVALKKEKKEEAESMRKEVSHKKWLLMNSPTLYKSKSK